MRKVVLMTIDTNKVLERDGNPCLHVGFELWEVYYDISLHDLFWKEVLVGSSGVGSAHAVSRILAYTKFASTIHQRNQKTAFFEIDLIVLVDGVLAEDALQYHTANYLCSRQAIVLDRYRNA